MEHGIPEDVWKKVRTGAGEVLGRQFWDEIGRLLPKRTEPACDLFRWNGSLVCIAEVPGVSEQGALSVSISGRQLHIRGAKTKPFPVTEEQALLAECVYGEFHRIVELPDDVVQDGVRARCHNGRLIVELQLRPLEAEAPVEVQFDRKIERGNPHAE